MPVTGSSDVYASREPSGDQAACPAFDTVTVTVDDARGYFGTTVDAYLDGGRLPGEPASTVVDVRDGLRVVREGAVPADPRCRARIQFRVQVAPRRAGGVSASGKEHWSVRPPA